MVYLIPALLKDEDNESIGKCTSLVTGQLTLSC